MSASTFTTNGKRFVILPEIEYRRLRESKRDKTAEGEWGLPLLPAKLASGNYPAVEYARALIVRAGPSRIELAHRAKVRVQTLNRIERAKMTGSSAVMEKLDSILNAPSASSNK